MKIGLDSTRREFSKGLVRELEKENLFLVDVSVKKEKNEGYEIYKKTMGANKSRLDLFIGVYLTERDEKEGSLQILYDCTFLGKYFANYIYDSLRVRIGTRDLTLKCGEELYLLKETKAPAVMIKGNLENEDIEIEGVLKDIIHGIFKMEIK